MSKAEVLPGLGTGSIKSLQVYRAGALPGPCSVFWYGHRGLRGATNTASQRMGWDDAVTWRKGCESSVDPLSWTQGWRVVVLFFFVPMPCIQASRSSCCLEADTRIEAGLMPHDTSIS
jgi:hypothetical protein